MFGGISFCALLCFAAGVVAANENVYTCKEAYGLLSVDEALATRLWSREAARAKAGVRSSVAADGNGPCPYAQGIYGVLLSRGQKLDQALSYLSAGVQEHGQDWVSSSYLGATYELLARRISARTEGDLASSSSALTAYRKALQGAVQYLSAAVNGLQDTSLELPHAVLAQKPTYLYRSLGNALLWLNRTEEARILHRKAVQQNIGWVSEWARPADALPVVLPFPIPFFEENSTSAARGEAGAGGQAVAGGRSATPLPGPLVQLLRTFTEALPQIRKEFFALMNSSAEVQGPGVTSLPALFKAEEAGLQEAVPGQRAGTGGESWGVYVLKVDGTSRRDACQRAPITCLTLQHPLTAVSSGQAKFSVMLPGTHVRPHAGPTNGRLRMHCTLSVMHGGPASATFRVGNVTRHWSVRGKAGEPDAQDAATTEGQQLRQDECFLFDESFEHEVSTWTVQQVEAARLLETSGSLPRPGVNSRATTRQGQGQSVPVDELGNVLHTPYRAVLLVDIINPFVSTGALLQSVSHPLAWQEASTGLLQLQQACHESLQAWWKPQEAVAEHKEEL